MTTLMTYGMEKPMTYMMEKPMPSVMSAAAIHLCHPGLDPGSIFWTFATGDGGTWIPDQVRDDNTDNVRDDKTNDVRDDKTNGVQNDKTHGVEDDKTNGVRGDTTDDNGLGSIIQA